MRSSPSILVVGDIGLDIDVYCKSNRYSQANPYVSVLEPYKEVVRPGMALKVSNILDGVAGLEVFLEARVNRSPANRKFLAHVARYAGNIVYTPCSGATNTTKVRYYEDGEMVSRVDFDASYSRRPVARDFEQSYNVLAISDYNKGAYTDDELKHLIARQGKRITIMVDPHPSRDLSAYVGADIIKVNSKEADHYGIRYLTAGFKTVIVTNAEEGVEIYENKTVTIVPPPKLDNPNPVGAGDAFFAGLIAGVASGLSTELSVTAGNSFAYMYLKEDL